MEFEQRIEIKHGMKLTRVLLISFVVLTFDYLIFVTFELTDKVSGILVQISSITIVAIFCMYTFRTIWKRVSKVSSLVRVITFVILNHTSIFLHRRFMNNE